MSNLQRTLLKGRLPPTIPTGRIGRSDSFKMLHTRDFNPILWSEFFAEREDIVVDQHRTFRIYRTKKPEKVGPILLLLHGGGYSGLTWSHFCVQITNMIHCQCISIDLRGHGDTVSDNENDLSKETLIKDINDFIKALYPDIVPSIYLVGHSMGGAIAVHFAADTKINNIVGITVIDVVEGTAMEALASMQSFLRSRPTHFKSIPSAIEWCTRSGQIRNLYSAKVSMPGQIINCQTKKLATNELPLPDNEMIGASSNEKFVHPNSICEDEEENLNAATPDNTRPASELNADAEHFQKPQTVTVEKEKNYTWRIDLSKSEQYWFGWFSGLSDKFLSLGIPKQLLLASIDGLDKTLTVGQMQGKFQMQVLARCGHAVHEDRPVEVAEVIGTYLIRNRVAKPVGEFRTYLPAC